MCKLTLPSTACVCMMDDGLDLLNQVNGMVDMICCPLLRVAISL